MKETKSRDGIKTKVSPKVAVGVILVCIGVALGAVAFNGLVPGIFMAGTSNTTVAQTGWTGWMYVYGPDKKTTTDWNNLVTAIGAGADVKAVISGRESYMCSRVRVNGPDVTCYSELYGEFKNYADKAFSIGSNYIIQQPTKFAQSMASVDLLESGANRINSSADLATSIKWYIKL